MVGRQGCCWQHPRCCMADTHRPKGHTCIVNAASNVVRHVRLKRGAGARHAYLGGEQGGVMRISPALRAAGRRVGGESGRVLRCKGTWKGTPRAGTPRRPGVPARTAQGRVCVWGGACVCVCLGVCAETLANRQRFCPVPEGRRAEASNAPSPPAGSAAVGTDESGGRGQRVRRVFAGGGGNKAPHSQGGRRKAGSCCCATMNKAASVCAKAHSAMPRAHV